MEQREVLTVHAFFRPVMLQAMYRFAYVIASATSSSLGAKDITFDNKTDGT